MRSKQYFTSIKNNPHEISTDPFYAVNSNYAEETLESNHYSRKLKADLFIDDRNLGGLPEWGMIYRMIHDKWGYEDIYQSSGNKEETKKRSFWKILFSKM